MGAAEGEEEDGGDEAELLAWSSGCLRRAWVLLCDGAGVMAELDGGWTSTKYLSPRALTTTWVEAE